MSPLRTTVLALIALLALTASGCGALTSEDASDASGSAVGQRADLGFSATTLDGRSFEGTSVRGQPTVLWFWAPWCTVCRAEAPDVTAVAAEFEGRVTFLGIAGLGPVSDMQAFVAETGTSGFEHVADLDGQLWQRFGVVAQPAFVFIDGDGAAELYAGGLDAEQLRDVADELVAG